MEIEQRVPPQVIGLLNLANLNNDNYGAFMQAWALKQAFIKVAAAPDLLAPSTLNPVTSNNSIAIGLVTYSALTPAQIARQRSLSLMAQHPTGKLKEDRHIAFQDFKHELSRLKRFAAFMPQLKFDQPIASDLSPERLKLVIGSDWVWYFDQDNKINPIFLADLPQFQEVRRYAYAASFGTTSPEHPAYQSYAPYLHSQWAKFRGISLREPTWLPEFERLALNLPLGPVTHVLDPALLLDRHYYQDMVARPLCSEPYILIYTLPFPHQKKDVDTLLDVLTSYVEQSGITKVIDISSCHILSHPDCVARIKALGIDYSYHYDTGPDDFVNWVAHAQLVLTPSFHGMVYSLLFGTPFSYFALRGSDPRVITLEQVFEITPLKMIPERSFDLKTFNETLTDCKAKFAERIGGLRQLSYQVLRSIIQD